MVSQDRFNWKNIDFYFFNGKLGTGVSILFMIWETLCFFFLCLINQTFVCGPMLCVHLLEMLFSCSSLVSVHVLSNSSVIVVCALVCAGDPGMYTR